MSKSNREKAIKLLEDYKNGCSKPKDEHLIQRWFSGFQKESNAKVLPRGIKEEVYADVLSAIASYSKQSKFRRLSKYAAVAAIVALVGVWVSLYLPDFFNQSNENNYVGQGGDVLPGGNEATLLLSDGTTIKLGRIEDLSQSITGIEVNKTAGVISFSKQQERFSLKENELEEYYTMITDRGGQYTVVMADGSTVKLNSNSRLRFPMRFVANRKVELQGEAYFDVKRDEKHPFSVDVNFQEIEVLGTQFNVKSYLEENLTTTTLVSGSVKVRSKNAMDQDMLVLKPGEYATNGAHQKLKLHAAKIEKIKAWKEGEFHFDGENLEEIMSILARWYDIEVKYEYKPSPNIRYGGIISRDKNLSTVLGLLQGQEGLRFEINGREVSVKK